MKTLSVKGLGLRVLILRLSAILPVDGAFLQQVAWGLMPDGELLGTAGRGRWDVETN